MATIVSAVNYASFLFVCLYDRMVCVVAMATGMRSGSGMYIMVYIYNIYIYCKYNTWV